MLPQAVAEHYRGQQRLTAATLVQMRRMWAQVSTADFEASWAELGPRMVLLLTAAQLNAATAGAAYVPEVLSETGQPSGSFEAVNPASLAGVASDGRSLSGLMYVPVIEARAAQAAGVSESGVMDTGRVVLTRIVRTQVADAARVSAGVAIASRPRISGYVRMLNPPSCSRCATLAGKHYKWNAGFRRHISCDCRHIPSGEDMAGDLRTDPDEYFDSLTPAEQDKAFTASGAQAIRDGADVSQVVNVRRGAGLSTAAPSLTGAEARLLTSTEGMTRRGVAYNAMRPSGARARLMPESLYQAAEDRADAIRLLKLYGYLL